MEEIVREQARLITLKALAGQVDETLNSDLLMYELQAFGINKPREWLHEQLKWLQTLDAITLRQAGSLLVAKLAARGAEHLNYTIAIEGIQRPSRPGG